VNTYCYILNRLFYLLYSEAHLLSNKEKPPADW